MTVCQTPGAGQRSAGRKKRPEVGPCDRGGRKERGQNRHFLLAIFLPASIVYSISTPPVAPGSTDGGKRGEQMESSGSFAAEDVQRTWPGEHPLPGILTWTFYIG